MSTPLIDIAMMNFAQLSDFVATATSGERYIANPSSEANEIDRDVCGEYIINTVIMPALKSEHKRVDSRSLKAQNGDFELAQMLASVARTYWQDRGFIIAQNARLNRAISAQIKEEERAQAKADLVALQFGTFGAMVEAKKAHKKDALQACWDFEESELIAQKMSNEGLAGKHSTLEAIA